MIDERMKIDLLIDKATILTMNENMKTVEKGWIAINDGIILEVGNYSVNPENSDQGKDPLNRYNPLLKIDGTGKIVLPGFINTHTHVPMSYFKGLADDLPLHTWLNDYIWPKEKEMVKAEYVYHASLHGIAELIRNGVTLFNDMYFESKMLAKAAKKAGIRAVLGEGTLDFPVANHQNALDALKYSLNLHQQYKEDQMIEAAISPHAIYTCGKETLEKAIEIARSNGMLIHTHLAETKQEYDEALEKHKMTPTEYLDSIGFWGDDVIAAHCVWLSDNDIDILAEKGVSIAINTESNLKLASGFLPLKKCLVKRVNMTTGTDGVASNNNLSIIEELGITAKVHKALNNDPTFLPAKEIIKFPTINAARALKKNDKLGSLEKGKNADLIIIDTNDLESLPLYDPYSQIVYNLSSANITDVLINGQFVMLNRQLTTLDEEEIKERAHYYKEKMRN
ncbi:MAG: amidohydrolase [Candidatus Cloacimonetes bacterium]|nr:amidohydrolase [Candidatus Cloacimonadota bacterium]